jgi:preprotein translocase subunit YajC
MYFLMIRPQKKREKEINEMRNSVKVGDDIITIGGICGRVVKTKEEDLTIQVGADKTKFEIKRWAVSKVVSEGSAPKKRTEPEADEKADGILAKPLPKRLKPKSAEAEAEAGTEAEE